MLTLRSGKLYDAINSYSDVCADKGLLSTNVTTVAEVRSASFGLVLHVHHICRYVAHPGECYYNTFYTMPHVCMLFH